MWMHSTSPEWFIKTLCRPETPLIYQSIFSHLRCETSHFNFARFLQSTENPYPDNPWIALPNLTLFQLLTSHSGRGWETVETLDIINYKVLHEGLFKLFVLYPVIIHTHKRIHTCVTPLLMPYKWNEWSHPFKTLTRDTSN